MAEQTRPVSAFRDFDRWGVYNKPTQNGHKGSRISFGVQITEDKRVIPRIGVNTGNPDDEFKGFIGQGFQMEVMNMVLDTLRKVALGEPTPKPYQFENYGSAGGNEDGQGFEKVLKTKLAIGKDDNGIVWMGLVKENMTKRKIDILLNEYHRIIGPNGEYLSPAEGSVLQAVAMADGLKAAYASFAATERPPFTPNGRNQRYGNQAASPAKSSQVAEFDGLDL